MVMGLQVLTHSQVNQENQKESARMTQFGWYFSDGKHMVKEMVHAGISLLKQ